MDRSNIVLGHHSREKREAARQMRRHMTPAEEALWLRLRDRQLVGLHFRRQQVVDGYIADFYCHQAGLIVEVDGPVHLAQAEYDAERTRAFEHRGLRVLRFTNELLLDQMDGVLDEIAGAALPARARYAPPA